MKMNKFIYNSLRFVRVTI